ncbi:MAG: hypothetical protein NTW79_00690 [Candidatus Berkelbacteria bacterium]|nr:hypothetical protein [Candidatus Berkelbacteria bacterium]
MGNTLADGLKSNGLAAEKPPIADVLVQIDHFEPEDTKISFHVLEVLAVPDNFGGGTNPPTDGNTGEDEFEAAVDAMGSGIPAVGDRGQMGFKICQLMSVPQGPNKKLYGKGSKLVIGIIKMENEINRVRGRIWNGIWIYWDDERNVIVPPPSATEVAKNQTTHAADRFADAIVELGKKWKGLDPAQSNTRVKEAADKLLAAYKELTSNRNQRPDTAPVYEAMTEVEDALIPLEKQDTFVDQLGTRTDDILSAFGVEIKDLAI